MVSCCEAGGIMITERKFELGRTLITPGAQALLESEEVTPSSLLDRHIAGDWGDLSRTDAKANDQALKNGDERIFSVYEFGEGIPKQKVWIITEWNRSVTTILRPEDY